MKYAVVPFANELEQRQFLLEVFECCEMIHSFFLLKTVLLYLTNGFYQYFFILIFFSGKALCVIFLHLSSTLVNQL